MARSRILMAFMALVLSPHAAGIAHAKLGGGQEHIINGHPFMPSQFVLDPFVETSLTNTLGAASAIGLSTTVNDLDGSELFTFDGDVLFATLGLGYQNLIGSRTSLGLSAGGSVRTGQDAFSFIAEGADLGQKIRAWSQYRIHRGNQDQISAGLDWSYSKYTSFTPGKFAADIASGVGLANANIVYSEKFWTARFLANWAHAFSPAFGLRASGAFGLYESPESSSTFMGSHRLGILGEVDFAQLRGGVPLGVTLGYTQNLPDTDPYTGPSGLLLGLWYTGRDMFVLGTEFGWMKQPVSGQQTDTIDAAFAVFILQLYF